jgi:hypothetical protein
MSTARERVGMLFETLVDGWMQGNWHEGRTGCCCSGDCGDGEAECVGGIHPTVRTHDPHRLLIVVTLGFSRGMAGFGNRQMFAIVFVLIRTFCNLAHLIQLSETALTKYITLA